MKIVIAEDQPLILKDLCLKIKRTDSEAEIAAAVLNGRDALQNVIVHKPDVLITDIRMPVMSGLSLIEEIRKQDINVHTVIVSGYKDFEYAREAMKLGVDDYLLKPLSEDDIRFMLLSLKEKITIDRSDRQQFILESLLRSSTYAVPRTQTLFPYHHYYMMLIMTGSYPTFSLDYMTAGEPADLLFPLADLLSPLLKEKEHFYLCQGKFANECICIFCLNDSDNEVLDTAALMIRERAGTDHLLTVCISRRLTHIDSIGVESHIMRSHLAGNLIFGKSGILYADVFSINTNTNQSLLKEEELNQFLYFVQEKKNDQFIQKLHVFLICMEDRQTTQQNLAAALKKIFCVCFGTNTENGPSCYDMDIDEFLTYSKSYRELFSYLTFLFQQLMKQTSSPVSSDSEQLVLSIRSYMEEHYMDNVNIHELAVIFSITPAYFSRLFKKHTGRRPIEYLTAIRISHACDYLKNTEIPIKDISEMCGYSSAFHFSKAFKSITGISPSGYRIQKRGVSD